MKKKKHIVLIACIFSFLLLSNLLIFFRPTNAQDGRSQEQYIQFVSTDSFSYAIIKTNIIPGIKRGLEIRLNKKISDNDLRLLALKLKVLDPNQYERTFISYYLPDMKTDCGCWATTNFNPDLEIKIIGLTLEEEKKLSKQPPPTNVEVLGRWMDETPLFSNLTTIFREKGKLYIEQLFSDGQRLKYELNKKKSSKGRRFDKISSSTGEYWIISPSDDLQIRDTRGLISIAKRLP